MKAEKFEGVVVDFVSVDASSQLRATIIRGDDHMVIDLPKQAAGGPYLVRAQKVTGQHFFAGQDCMGDQAAVDVVARWSLLGDVYVGIWIEDGAEYLFSFRIPRARSPRA